MSRSSPVATIMSLATPTAGAFRGRDATQLGVSRKQLATSLGDGALERIFHDTYRLRASVRSHQQMLHAALLWAGDRAAAHGRSAAVLYRFDGVHADIPEIVVPTGLRRGSPQVVVRSYEDRRALMIRNVGGIPVTGVEATLVALAHLLDAEALEIACEDARRRRLTSVAALRSYLNRFGTNGRKGVAVLRRLVDQLDPRHSANSTLEVMARRLLVSHGITGFVREFPLAWNGRTYRFDFAFPHAMTILETNGRRWHDDATDYEYDNDKWSVPGRHGYRLVLATWNKVTRAPDELLEELLATMVVRVPSGDADPQSARR
jgi:very-short-patch-repair endonuclease